MLYPFGPSVPSVVLTQGNFRTTLWHLYNKHHKHFEDAEAVGQTYVVKALANGAFRLIQLNPDGGSSPACYINKRNTLPIQVQAGDLLVGTIAFEGDGFFTINVIANFGQIT